MFAKNRLYMKTAENSFNLFWVLQSAGFSCLFDHVFDAYNSNKSEQAANTMQMFSFNG